jgi:hypothetical protein
MKNPFTEAYKQHQQNQALQEEAKLQAELERERRIQGSLWNHPTLMPGHGVVTVNGSQGVLSPYHNVARQEPAEPSITLDHPAMQATLDELSNLWAAKFSDAWVPVEQIQDDMFWSIAARRLKMKDYLEYFPEVQVYRLCK